jgi:hypothetical protein
MMKPSFFVVVLVGLSSFQGATTWAQPKENATSPLIRQVDVNKSYVRLGEGKFKVLQPLEKGTVIEGQHQFQSEIWETKIETKKFLELRNLTFKDCSITMEDNQYCVFKSCRFINTTVKLLGTWDCVLEDCSFIQNKETCLIVEGSAQRQTNCLTISRCRFEGNENDVNVYIGERSRKIILQDCKSHGPNTKTHIKLFKSDVCRIVDCNITQKGIGVDADTCKDLYLSGNIMDNLNIAVQTVKSQLVFINLEERNIFPKDQPNGVNVLHK